MKTKPRLGEVGVPRAPHTLVFSGIPPSAELDSFAYCSRLLLVPWQPCSVWRSLTGDPEKQSS